MLTAHRTPWWKAFSSELEQRSWISSGWRGSARAVMIKMLSISSGEGGPHLVLSFWYFFQFLATDSRLFDLPKKYKPTREMKEGYKIWRLLSHEWNVYVCFYKLQHQHPLELGLSPSCRLKLLPPVKQLMTQQQIHNFQLCPHLSRHLVFGVGVCVSSWSMHWSGVRG